MQLVRKGWGGGGGYRIHHISKGNKHKRLEPCLVKVNVSKSLHSDKEYQ